jgi:hypothetical protein
MTQPHTAQTPVFITPDALVLQGHELREGIELATTSRFGDDIWDLHPINHQDQLVRSILNFPYTARAVPRGHQRTVLRPAGR